MAVKGSTRCAPQRNGNRRGRRNRFDLPPPNAKKVTSVDKANVLVTLRYGVVSRRK